MNRPMFSFSPFWPALLLVALHTATASAGQLHYFPITDSRFSDPILANTYGDVPLEELIVVSGTDDHVIISNDGLTYELTDSQFSVRVALDAPAREDITNTSATAFFEYEVVALDTDQQQTIELGLTDLQNDVYLDEAAGTIEGTKDGVGADTENLPRWSENYPLRIQLYYHFRDFVITYVVIDDVLGTSTASSWSAALNPFDNLYPVPGTDPDNLIVYPFISCEAPCTLTVLDWTAMNCDTVDGEVDVDGCLLLPGIGNGQLDPGETCDDGNLLPGDGCDENGQLEKSGRKCQNAIGKAGRVYVNLRLKHLQKCRKLLNKGKQLFQDEDKTLALTDRSECPLEFKTAIRLAKAGEKARRLVTAKCTDPLVGALAACGETVDEIVSSDGASGCLVETHDANVADLLTTQYGG